MVVRAMVIACFIVTHTTVTTNTSQSNGCSLFYSYSYAAQMAISPDKTENVQPIKISFHTEIKKLKFLFVVAKLLLVGFTEKRLHCMLNTLNIFSWEAFSC